MNRENEKEFLITTLHYNVKNDKHSHIVNDHAKYRKNETKDFINKYFNCFFLLTRLGKSIFARTHNYNDMDIPIVIEAKYLAAILAKTYLVYKKESDYLQKINIKVEILAKMHTQQCCNRIDENYTLYQTNKKYLNYDFFHFLIIQKAFENKSSLEEILKRTSNGNYAKLNTGIIHRIGLKGLDLANECTQTLMELNCTIPEIKIQYIDFFDAVFENVSIKIA